MGVGTPAGRCCSELTCVLVMVFSFERGFRCELIQTLAEHSIERGKRMDDIGEGLQWCPQFDREYQLAHDLARARRDECRADQHAAFAIADEFERSPMEVVDVAARGL